MAQGHRAVQRNYDYYRSQGMGEEEALRKAAERKKISPPTKPKESWYDSLIRRIKEYLRKRSKE